MFRRLHFLLPNAKLAQNVTNELLSMGVNSQNIHTYAEHNYPIGELRPATLNQAHDKARQLEDFFWSGNLVLFAIFTVIFIAAMLSANYILALISAAIMLVSFAAGNFFIKHIPHTHLNEFKDALSHNELLMMIDVPDETAATVENSIHRHHPAAVEAGSSWTLKNADI